ncbi:MAG: hypothetical protein IKD41_06615, partial [Alistipes sp.]|nr:hypothetical protein [Alistipes sp.]
IGARYKRSAVGIFAERCIYALLSTNGCFDLAAVERKFSKEFKENREVRDIRERNNFVCIRI